MSDSRKTKAQLLEEVAALRQRVAELEAQVGARPADKLPPRQDEAHLETMFRAMPHLVVRVARDGTLSNFQVPEDFPLPLPASELEGRRVSDLVEALAPWLPPEVLQEGMARLARALDGGGMEHYEFSLEAAGTPWHFEIRLIGYGDYALAIARDISRERNAEIALRQSEERFRGLFESAAVGVAIVDADGVILRANPRLAEMVGCAPEELVGENFGAITHPDDLPREQALVREMWAERRPHYQIEKRYVRRDTGGIIWVRVTSSIIRDADGQPRYGIGVVENITERKQAESALRQSEETLRAFVHHATDGIALLDDEGRIMEWNPACARLTGLDRAAALERPLWETMYELATPETQAAIPRDRMQAAVTAAVDSSAPPWPPRHAEVTVQRPDGVRRVIQIVVFRVEAGNGVVLGSILRDVTEQRRLQRRLRKQIAVFEAGPACFVRWKMTPGPSFDVEYISPNVAQFGYEPEDFTSGRVAFVDDFMHPADVDHTVETAAAAFATGTNTFETECRVICADGRVRWVHGYGVPQYDGNGQVLHIDGYLLDITRRKEAAIALRRSEDLFRSVIEQSRDGIRLIDREGTIIEWNRGSEEITGLSRAEAVGRLFWEVLAELTPDDRCMADLQAEIERRVRAMLRRAAAGEVFDLENAVLQRPDGTQRVVQNRIFPIRTADGWLLCGIVRDITEQKEAEDKLHRTQRRLDQMLQTMLDGMVMVDTIGQIVFANHAAERILEVHRDEMSQRYYNTRDWRQIDDQGEPYPLDQLPLAIALRERHAVGGLEHGIIAPNGEVRWLSVNAAPLLDEDGQIIGAVASFRDITAQRETEEAYRALVDHSSQGLQIIQEGRVVFANQAAADMSGYTIEELLAHTPEERIATIHPDDRAMVIQRYRDRLADKPVPERYELRLLRKDGSVYWVEMYASMVTYQGQSANQMALVDITERKEAEEAYRALVDQSLQALQILQDGRVVFANQAMADMTGYTVEELLAHTPQERAATIHPDDREQVIQRYLDRLAGQPIPDRYELRVLRKDGSTAWVEAHASLIQYQGQPAVQGALVDITERKEAEQALRAARQMLQQVIDHIPLRVFWKDLDLAYLGCNRQFSEGTGVGDPSAVIGRTDHDLPWADHADQYQARDRQVIESGQMLTYEGAFEEADGSQTLWRVRKVPLRDVDGALIGVLATWEDITEERQAEEHRLALAVESQKVDILSGFIAAASHEFRTPLSIIYTSLYMLRRAIAPDHHDHLDIIKAQAGFIHELVESMLALTRLDSSPGLERTLTDLNGLVGNLEVGLATRVDEAGLALVTELDADLPGVPASATELQLALSNIVQNAIHHTPAPGTITIRTRREDDRAVIEIADTGEGIAPEHLDRVFDRFYRVEQARTRRGAGLGLAIARKVIALHGGEITVASTPGAGSTFTVWLPLG